MADLSSPPASLNSTWVAEESSRADRIDLCLKVTPLGDFRRSQHSLAERLTIARGQIPGQISGVWGKYRTWFGKQLASPCPAKFCRPQRPIGALAAIPPGAIVEPKLGLFSYGWATVGLQMVEPDHNDFSLGRSSAEEGRRTIPDSRLRKVDW